MAELDALLADVPKVAEESLAPDALDARLNGARQPFVVRGLAADWPVVRTAAKGGGAAARRYLLEHSRDRPFPVHVGRPGGGDRLFYDSRMAMDFVSDKAPLASILAQIEAAEGKPDAPLVYLSSIDLHDYFCGLHEANNLPLGDRRTLASIWIGTKARIASHNDLPHNLAVCAVGRRRFTLFPPGQFANLYLGPVDNSPAGRPVSMVDLAAPDLQAYPRFAEALGEAQVAELEPGDAIFVPSLWWHHVEGLDGFNVLVNYWWRDVPAYLGNPEDALNLALLAIRDLSDEDRAHWRSVFDHYVFSGGGQASAHLPDAARGILGPLTAATAGRIRAKLLRSLAG